MAPVGTIVTIDVQLFTATGLNGALSPVPGAMCTVAPPLTGVVSPGTMSDCRTSGLMIPIAAGTRAVVVASVTATGISLAQTVTLQSPASIGVS